MNILQRKQRNCIKEYTYLSYIYSSYIMYFIKTKLDIQQAQLTLVQIPYPVYVIWLICSQRLLVFNRLALAWLIRYIFYSNLQFLNPVIIKTKVILSQAQVTLEDFGYPVQALWFSCSKRLFYSLAFKYFLIESTYVVRTKFDIYFFILTMSVLGEAYPTVNSFQCHLQNRWYYLLYVIPHGHSREIANSINQSIQNLISGTNVVL